MHQRPSKTLRRLLFLKEDSQNFTASLKIFRRDPPFILIYMSIRLNQQLNVYPHNLPGLYFYLLTPFYIKKMRVQQ